MKIAVISDIHGNMEALGAVLEDIKEQKCGRIFVLGDYAMAGPEPKLVVDYFMNRLHDTDIDMIQGNTDLMIADYNDNLYEFLKEKAPVMAEALTNDVSILDEKEKEFLKHLPAQKEVFVEGVKFLLVHGSPRKNNEDIMPDLPLEKIEEMLEGVDAQVVFCGHTHIPCGYQTSGKQTVVNAGSVGRPFTPEPKSCYLVVTVTDGKYVFEHRFVEYDKQKASDKLKKRGFNGSEKLAKTLLDPKERHF